MNKRVLQQQGSAQRNLRQAKGPKEWKNRDERRIY